MRYNWVTGVRHFETGKIKFVDGHDDPGGIVTYVKGEVLQVYTGTWNRMGDIRRQVVLAAELPPPGNNEETFELVFEGPREEAIKLFKAYVGMLP